MGNDKKRRSRSKEREKDRDKRVKRSRSRSRDRSDRHKRHRSRSREKDKYENFLASSSKYDNTSNNKFEKPERIERDKYTKTDKDYKDKFGDKKDEKKAKKEELASDDVQDVKVKIESGIIKQEPLKKEPLSLEELLANKKAEEAAKSKVNWQSIVEGIFVCSTNPDVLARVPNKRTTCGRSS